MLKMLNQLNSIGIQKFQFEIFKLNIGNITTWSKYSRREFENEIEKFSYEKFSYENPEEIVEKVILTNQFR